MAAFLKNLPAENRKKIAHILAGVVILLHAYEKWEHGSSTAWVFLFFGILVLAIVVYHQKLHRRFRTIDAVFFVIEGILFAVTAYYYFSHHKTYLPWVYVGLSIAYLVMGFRRHRKLQSSQH